MPTTAPMRPCGLPQKWARGLFAVVCVVCRAVCGRVYSSLPALLSTGNCTVHLTRILGGGPNHGKCSRGTPGSIEKVNVVHLVIDMWEQLLAHYTHVPGSLRYGHARPTHVHIPWMEIDLEAFTRGNH